jgi:uncharacterized protein (TIGR02246 family)
VSDKAKTIKPKEDKMKTSFLQLKTIIPLAFLLYFAFGCQQPGEEVAEEVERAVDVETDITAINELWNQYASAVTTGDLDLWISLWADNGIQMAPGAPAVIGKEQIWTKYESIFPQFSSKMTIKNEETRVAGDWAYARGTYTLSMTPKAGGETVFIDGKFLTILKRQVNGSWKIFRDCFNSNVPASEK